MINKRMAVRWSILVLIVLLLNPFHLGTQADTDTQLSAVDELKSDLHEILHNPRLEHALAGVTVRTADSGEILYSHNGQTSVVPASGQKLLVGSAALDVLGEDHCFKTSVHTDGHQRGKVLHGHLYIKGTGDPTMLPERYEELAEQLADLGIQRIRGDLVGDDTWFDDVRLSLDLSWANQSSYAGAQVSALTVSPDEDYDAGTVIVEVHPAEEPGEEPEVQVTPETDYVTIVNEAETVEDGERTNISIVREHGNNNIVIEGSIPAGGNVTRRWVSVWEPTEYALDIFQQALEKQNIVLKGEHRVGELPGDATELGSLESMTIAELFTPYMKLSNNGHSEILTKTMGRFIHDEGSWDKGLEVVGDYLEQAGLNIDAIQLRDGSGMSHLNKIPTDEMTALLRHVQEEEWFDTFFDSMPVAGVSERMVGGTLRNRMQDTAAAGNVFAKTGTLTSKTSLSGYVDTQDDERLIFSIVFNNYIGSHPKSIEDEIAIRLAEFTRDE